MTRLKPHRNSMTRCWRFIPIAPIPAPSGVRPSPPRLNHSLSRIEALLRRPSVVRETMLRVGAWLADFESELFAFPYIRHDNQCDSISQALNDEGVRRVPSMTKENLEEQCRLVALMPRGVGHSRGKDQPAS